VDVEELAARMSQALELGTWREAVRLLHGLHPADVADLMGHLSPAQRRGLFSPRDPEGASEVILHLDKETRKSILSQLTRDRLSALIEEMATDDAADVVAELPPEEVKEVLQEIARLDRQESEAIEELLRYAPESAGGLMEPEVLALRSEATAGQALAELRRRRELEDVHNLFVIDAEGRPVGMVPLQRLVTADPGQSVASLMEPLPAVARVDMDQEEVAHLFKKYDLVSLPVVDERGRLVGRITVDDVMEVVEAEATEDFLRLGGLGKEERVSTPPLRSAWLRLPWLVVNLATAFLAAAVVSAFQRSISRVVALAVFMPVVAGMGGNAGTQTLTVIVRGLALGEITLGRAKRALLKELLVGLVNGAILGAITAGVAYLWQGNPWLGLVIGVAMVVNMLVAGFFGAIIPLALKLLGADPALSSSIFLTTFTDVCGFLAFLGFGTMLMDRLM